MFVKKDKFQLWFLIFIANSFFQSESSILNCRKQFGACQCHESYTKYIVNKNNVCYKVFDSAVTWYEASAACKREHSYILDWLSQNSSAHLELLDKGINVLWLGIRRISGFFVKQSFESELFRESKKLWGKIWKESVLLHDCVALNISSGLLSTHDCNTALPFICQNNQFPSQPIESLACRNNYFFSYQLPLNNENCIQIFSPAPFTEAQRICSGSGGVLASENVYSNVKYFENISEILLPNIKSFWLKNGTAICNLVGNECNKMQEHSFVCVQEAQNYVVIPKILPIIMESFRSTDSKYNVLTCDVKVNGKNITRKENLIYYQWYKNGIPISVHTHSFDFHYYPDPIKRISSPVVWQGIFYCDVQLLGSIKSFRSEDVNYFYSDVSTYLMIIKGLRNEKDRDFSQLDFINWKLDLNKSVSVITMDIQTRFSDFSWDFHNISIQDNHTTVTLLLYINQSATFQSNYFSETDVFEDLMIYKDNRYALSYWDDASLSIQNAAYCFEEEISIADSSFNGTLLWKNTVQKKNAVSEPLCLNRWKLQSRQCIPSFVTGAQWASFNYSQCTKYQPSVKNMEVQCPVGFSLLNQDICFKVYRDGQMWNNALEICSNSSSYMSDSHTLKDIAKEVTLEPLSYWLPVKILHNNIQWFGMKPESEWEPMQHLLAPKLEKENVLCATINQSLSDFEFNFELCCQKKAFACIQQPIKIIASIMFSRTWTKFSQNNSCYYSDIKKKTWAEANDTCESLPVNSSLLHSIQNLDVYYNFKLYFQKIAPIEKVTYWWINLVQENNELKWLSPMASSIEYVDWDAHTDFNLQTSGGLLMFDSSYNNNIQWTLKDLSSQEASLCEMHNCPDLGSTYAYIEDRTKSNEIPEEDYSKVISQTDMHCVPSGWFLLNSISWYKNGDFITSNNNVSKLSLSVKYPINIKDAVKFQGYYWCSIDSVYPLKRIFSPKILYRLPGIYTFLLYIQIISNELLPSCSEFVSKLKFSHDMLTFLNHSLPDGFLHIDFKSISCENKSFYINLYFKMGLKSEENMLNDIKTALHLNEASTKDYLKKRFINENMKVTARSTVACSRDKMVLNEKNITWPSTSIGEVTLSEEMCVTENGTALKRQCVGDFSVGAFWGPVSGKCIEIHSEITINLHKLSVSRITEENVLNTSLSLKMLTSAPEELCIADIQYVAQILKHMAGISTINPDVLDNILSTLDHLIEIKYQMESFSLYQTNASSEISLAFENILSNVDTDNHALKLSSNNIALSLMPLNLSESKYSTGGILKSWDMNVTVLYNGTKQLNKKFETFEAGIMLPDSLLVEKYSENTKNLAIIIRQSFYFAPNIEIVSPQIDVFLGNEQIYDVNPPIEMVFKLSQRGKTSKVSHYKCAYWDQQLNENFGGWSYKGCFSKLIGNNKMQCLCDHLTSFAVILEMKPGNEYLKVHQLTLSIITYIGCSLSILGLAIIILTFIVFRKWRKDVKNKVLFNLSLALISFLIILLTGIESQSSKYGCFAVAVFLHYFMLASFTWMLVEAVIQYLSFVKVIGTYIPCFMQKAMIFAWGMPLVIVVIVSSIDYRHYISRTKYCWLSGDIFYYAVAAPVLAMLTMNFLTFALVLYSNTCGRPNKHLRSNQSERRETITTAKAMFCVSILLGLSWIFGFLAIDGAKLLFQYLFAGTATLQGFLMCVFFVFRQKSSRDLWTNLISPVTTPDVSRASHVTGMTDITSRAINNHSRQNTPDRFSRAVYKARLSYIMFN